MGRGLGGGFASLQGAALAQGQDALTKARLAFQQQQNQLMLQKQGAQSDYDKWKYGMEKGEFDTTRQRGWNVDDQTTALQTQLLDMVANTPDMTPEAKAAIIAMAKEAGIDPASLGFNEKGNTKDLNAKQREDEFKAYREGHGGELNKVLNERVNGLSKEANWTAQFFVWDYMQKNNGKYPSGEAIVQYMNGAGFPDVKLGAANSEASKKAKQDAYTQQEVDMAYGRYNY
jgi:hypothetical protein